MPTGVCQLDTGSETDMEAAVDPLLCHFQGPVGTLLRRGNLYGPDPTDTYTGETYGYRTLDLCHLFFLVWALPYWMGKLLRLKL